MSEPPILIHLHIPKNAGTTLSRMLKVHLLLHPPTRVLHHEQMLGYYTVLGPTENRLRRIESATEKERGRIRFFEAHCGYGVHKRLPRTSAYLTVVRDPVDRVLSVFYFMKQQGLLTADAEIGPWLDEHPADVVWHVDNGQVRYLASDDGRILDGPIGSIGRDELEKAKARLENDIAVVGLVERFDETVVLLREALGWSGLKYATSNVTRKRKAKDAVADNVRGLILERSELDAELFEFAKELFERRVRAYGPSFEDDLRKMRQANTRYARRAGRLYDLLPRARRVAQKLIPGRG